ncbi:MAG: NapC/NirT family cytochrome c [Calditrichae bacterium]|nr:NapC/NirT family cytochrome c [Calditrichota bacterium]MCB9058258.1 NapC/NirT family cytochrome c [Calditrichia bacterium]
MKISLPKSTQNWITLIGAMIALIAVSMIIFLFTISAFLSNTHTYLGLVIYILLPAVMIIGLILIPIGMLITVRRREGKEPTTGVWPRVDLNEKRHRNAFFIFSIGTTLLVFASAVGSYEVFHFTESVEFCGTTCHTVMKPEYTAYQNSAHARVACVACHVGTGADWYVRSKLSGAYQVYAVIADVYPRPIPTPVHNLRPARETCEQCHWPQKFYSRKLRVEDHYLGNEENTEWEIQLIMKIGAEEHAKGLSEGIHWHINPDVRVEYITTDERRQEIPWVRFTNLKTNESKVYIDEENPIDEEMVKPENMRVMDCMDCHNRPSHDYKTPINFVNLAISKNPEIAELPELKYTAVDLCSEEYGSTDSAMQAIENGLKTFYEENYPEVLEEKSELFKQAVIDIQTAFSQNIFPEMKVRWDAYPNNIGHMNFNGCFRCHNDRHTSDDGQVISRECNACHLITAQGTKDDMQLAMTGQALEFMHPDGEEDWKDSLCSDCHAGVNP